MFRKKELRSQAKRDGLSHRVGSGISSFLVAGQTAHFCLCFFHLEVETATAEEVLQSFKYKLQGSVDYLLKATDLKDKFFELANTISLKLF